MGKRILVTGGAGYIGSHMVHNLLEAGFSPVVVDNLSTGDRSKVPLHVPFYQDDIANIDTIDELFQKEQINAVMHFAASVKVEESVSNPAKYYQNNCFATANLLECMKKNNVKKIIFSSTAAIYGEPQTLPITEDHPKNPINPYGTTKLICEKILADFCKAHEINYVCLRYFNAASADSQTRTGFGLDNPSHLIPRVLLSIADRNSKFYIYGTDYDTIDGTCVRDYIHVSDLCDAHTRAYDYLLNGGKSTAFNLGNGVGHSVKQILDTAEKVTGEKLEIHLADRRPGDASMLFADSSKANKILNWQPKRHELQQIVEDAWRWIQSQTPIKV